MMPPFAYMMIAAEGGTYDFRLLLLLALIVLLAVLSPILVRRRNKPEAPRLGDIRKMEDDIKSVRGAADQALVDLLETSREISAQIDTKIRVLNKLVKDADDRCRKLEKLVKLADGEDVDMDETTVMDVKVVAPSADRDEKEAPAVPVMEDISKPKRTQSGRWASKIHARIEDLDGQGKTPAEIARATNLSLQEVNLVLHMLRCS